MEKKKVSKKKAETVKKEKTVPKAAPKRYLFAIGRRKTATARVKLNAAGSGNITINGRPADKYFSGEALQKIITAPLTVLGLEKTVDIDVRAAGGGVPGQAAATALGIARALVMRDAASKTVLKKHGLLTRDARKKERKKPGLKRARRAPQWQKR